MSERPQNSKPQQYRNMTPPENYSEAKAQFWHEYMNAITTPFKEMQETVRTMIAEINQDVEKYAKINLAGIQAARNKYIDIAQSAFGEYIHKLTRAYIKDQLKVSGLDIETLNRIVNDQAERKQPVERKSRQKRRKKLETPKPVQAKPQGKQAAKSDAVKCVKCGHQEKKIGPLIKHLRVVHECTIQDARMFVERVQDKGGAAT